MHYRVQEHSEASGEVITVIPSFQMMDVSLKVMHLESCTPRDHLKPSELRGSASLATQYSFSEEEQQAASLAEEA